VSQPFHFAFFVRDLASTRRFYGEILGCREGRSTETWVDFDPSGNALEFKSFKHPEQVFTT
jgi:extradiol dioxygenase family protein